ncbi:MAG: FAD-binding protein [Epsilonproteobacteria bacterium]|nr:FAD-binding protein [Campylobacterota bacterium]OIO18009.1 MAG: succinate dehydrogenase [Helicobacteraceae bacterium CG1_02_36_14]PIP10016.1 MAG: succinate dehydrogenase [Sulfurimonas sp. CG23_combo_of_CG06-09_8_20_14_all_36_33]PIS26118.1 MAG: succinate dehydrogenase [Sulfurimonas sp. CG08_land_8_20_14_0_20_36_33]PIU34417.1 MAG: succinate dehydrogenase [Sulfurimonas sp. CG07_land_8_20_14_0_80_36_56]PIV03256.1 MAG: succinate dehydrogenase [Sulfurimonas sp. CG03_land_8_20_14_0_80_36_25]PIV36
MRSDVLIIGAGGAGLVAALSAHEAGAKVRVLTKEYPTRSQTCMAQGGINAALGNVEEDSVASHIQDTLKSAHGIAEERAVKLLCESAPYAVAWLDSIGVCFSRTKDAKIAQRKLGGAYAARACYAQDYTGLKILHTLYDRCVAAGIEILNERYLLNFITHTPQNADAYVGGATVLNSRTGEVETYESASVIIATGGYSRIYDKHSTNSTRSTGDGIAAGLRAGARVSDMEFIQFHPTALKNSSILISESARGSGGYLVNSKGERFTNELAPRDEVARAIHAEMQKGEEVYLDIRHLGEAFIDEELPQERKLAKLYENVDPVYDLVPIKPVAHYTMGGLEVNKHSQTKVRGLFAVGECANHKVHGANRLGGNSLLELVVFGREAGKNAALYAKDFDKEIDASTFTQSAQNFILGVKHFTNQIDFYEKRSFIGNIFYNNAGVIRDDMGLKAVLGAIRQIQREIPFMGPKDKSKVYNTNLIEFIEFGNMVELSEIILVSAISRNESRGAHYRSDIPQENDIAYKAHTIAWKEEGVLCADFME